MREIRDNYTYNNEYLSDERMYQLRLCPIT